MTDFIVWLITMICTVLIMTFLIDFDIPRRNRIKQGIGVVLLFISGMLYGIFPTVNDYQKGQIDALKGKYKYRMEITYKKVKTNSKDTLKSFEYIPVDTTFIKIK